MSNEISKYKFSSDFKKLSEEDFIKEMKSRFKTKVKDARELYKQLHGNGSTTSEKNKAVDKEISTGQDSVPGTEEAEEVSDRAGEGEAG